jgi:hypothetical protein
MRARRKLAERFILGALTEQLTRAEHIRHVLERVEAEVARLSEHLPETIPSKESELTAEERRLANFVDFIGEGRGSQALANALVETERRVEALREELEALSRSRAKVYQPPPVEWIEERLSRVQEVLEGRTEQSALLLRDVLGTIRLEPRRGDVGRPYYLAETSIDCIAGTPLAPPRSHAQVDPPSLASRERRICGGGGAGDALGTPARLVCRLRRGAAAEPGGTRRELACRPAPGGRVGARRRREHRCPAARRRGLGDGDGGRAADRLKDAVVHPDHAVL